MTEEKISIPILVVDDDPVSRTLLKRASWTEPDKF